jgi:hypothetical protein
MRDEESRGYPETFSAAISPVAPRDCRAYVLDVSLRSTLRLRSAHFTAYKNDTVNERETI